MTDTATRLIGEEAADWVIRLQEDALSPGEREAFVGWLRASPVHIREYLQAEAAWFALEDIDPGRRLDVSSILAAADETIVPFPAVTADVGGREDSGVAGSLDLSRRRWWMAAAAMVAGAVVVPAVFYFNEPGGEVFATRLGEQRTIVLEDGSVMELNTGSRVEVRFSRDGRNVEILGGEAYFTVRSDAGRPFRVFSDGIEVKAVGTQFNVYRQPGQTVVTVSEGRVAVQRPARSGTGAAGSVPAFELGVGGQAVIEGDRHFVATDSALMTRALAWRERKLVFADEPLSRVVAEVNRYNARQLVVADPSLASRRISGVFNVHDPDVIIRFLTRSGQVSVSEGADGAWVLADSAASVSDGADSTR